MLMIIFSGLLQGSWYAACEYWGNCANAVQQTFEFWFN